MNYFWKCEIFCNFYCTVYLFEQLDKIMIINFTFSRGWNFNYDLNLLIKVSCKDLHAINKFKIIRSIYNESIVNNLNRLTFLNSVNF